MPRNGVILCRASPSKVTFVVFHGGIGTEVLKAGTENRLRQEATPLIALGHGFYPLVSFHQKRPQVPRKN
jgi:hypothetical protein